MAKLSYNQSEDLTLSYSILGQFHDCPRKFQLAHIIKVYEKDEFREFGGGNINFAFGHCVAAGIQAKFAGCTEEDIMWEMFLAWDMDLLADNSRAKKSFPLAVLAYQKFFEQLGDDFEDYELAFFRNKDGEEVPAVELTFKLNLERFKANFQGHIDIVLRHKYENYLLVVELKTSSSLEPDEASYSNSSQALGYSLAVDKIAENCTIPGTRYGYDIFYPVYSSSAGKWTLMRFHKDVTDRLNFVQDILLDVEEINKYREMDYFPKRGNSCFNFFKRCEHYDICGLSNENLTRNKELNQFDHLPEENISFVFSFNEIMEMQKKLSGESFVTASKFEVGLPL
jgi:hypothetical protein